jgi:UDP:flavonoid glycosyltransferase YjiC (YdhE family)
MSRILLAWELGTGFGHLAPFLGLLPRLMVRGHDVHIAARDIGAAARALGEFPVALHQAPLCLNTYSGLQGPPLNFSEILMRYGYLEPAMLGAMLKAWRSLIEGVRADMVIADHAPTALLAARVLGVARAVIGSPFNVPPAVAPSPNMRPWVAVPPARLEDSDCRVLEVINSQLPEGRQLPALHGIFGGAVKLLSGVPELDPYGARDPGDYLGLQSQFTGSAVPQWPAGEGDAVFAYLHADYPHLERALQALAASPARVLAHVPGAGDALLRRHAGARLQFAAGLLEFPRVVAECALCVCHGNVGTTLGMLQGGRPVLVLPKHLEHELLGRALERLGAGRVIDPADPAPDIAGALAAMLGDPAHGRNARAFAARHGAQSVGTMAERAVARIEASVAQGAGSAT